MIISLIAILRLYPLSYSCSINEIQIGMPIFLALCLNNIMDINGEGSSIQADGRLVFPFGPSNIFKKWDLVLGHFC